MIEFLLSGYLIVAVVILFWLIYMNAKETDQLKPLTIMVLSLSWPVIFTIVMISIIGKT